jgi:hypothetical protein
MKSAYTFCDRNFIRKITFDKEVNCEKSEDELLDEPDEDEGNRIEKTKLVRYLFDQEGFYYS